MKWGHENGKFIVSTRWSVSETSTMYCDLLERLTNVKCGCSVQVGILWSVLEEGGRETICD